MKYDPFKHHPTGTLRSRHSIRLRGYDYTQAGAYFVTILTHNRECLFGDIVDGEMRLNELGRVVATHWRAIPRHFKNVALDEWVVMPNHLHGIIVIGDDPRRGEAFPQTHSNVKPNSTRANDLLGNCDSGNASPLLGAIIGNSKSVSTRKINQSRDTAGTPLWHRNY
jgi:hypothetical protein